MASVNKVILIGNLGRDPEIRYTQSGEPIANFTLATNEVWNDKSGQKQERTEWHRVEVFGKTAQVVRDYVTKGRQVYIEGSIRYEEWTDKDGNKRNTTRIRVSGPGLAPRPPRRPRRGRRRARRAAARAGRAAAPSEPPAEGGDELPGLRRRRAVLATAPLPERFLARNAGSMATLLSLERYLPVHRYDQEVVTDWVRRLARVSAAGRGGGRRARRAGSAPLRLRLGRGEDARERRAHRGGLSPRRLRDAEPRVPRDRLPAGADVARRALDASGLAPSRHRLRGERLLHRLHDPGGRRLRRERALPRPAPRAAADHRGGLRRRRRRPRAGRRLPRRPPRPRRAPPRHRAVEPHVPALGPLGDERRLDRDLRRRGRRRGPRRRPAPARRRAASSACATRESLFFPDTTHLMGFELRN